MSIVNYGVSKHYAGSMVSDRCPLGYLLIMLIGDQLGLASSNVFGQGILEIGQGKVSEKSGNFTFYSLWEKPVFTL